MAREVECELCNDEGYGVRCPECDGDAIPCDECDGDGFTICSHCDSELTCEECNGKGSSACDWCDGEPVTYCNCLWGRAKRAHELKIIAKQQRK